MEGGGDGRRGRAGAGRVGSGRLGAGAGVVAGGADAVGQVVPDGPDHRGVRVRQPAGDPERVPLPQTAHHHQLLSGVAGHGRHPGGAGGHGLQRQRHHLRPLDVRLPHVRRVELARRLLLHRVHPTPVLHQRRPLLRHLAAAHVPPQDHLEKGISCPLYRPILGLSSIKRFQAFIFFSSAIIDNFFGRFHANHTKYSLSNSYRNDQFLKWFQLKSAPSE